ncbi:metal-dependent hydrolase [Acidobacteriota bacterium]
MPDLLSHSMAAWAASRVRSSRSTAWLVVTGTLLPDLLTRAPGTVMSALKDLLHLPREVFFLLSPFHSPLFLLPVCALIAFMFEESLRRHLFLCLTGGMLFHIFMDLFQRQVGGGYLLFFPLSAHKVQFGVAWGDYWAYWLVPLMVIALIVELARLRAERRRRKC